MCGRRRGRSATRTTTRCARASSRPSNANCSTAAASSTRSKRGWPSSTSSRGGTTPIVGTRPSPTSPRSTTNGSSSPNPSLKASTCPRNRVTPSSVTGGWGELATHVLGVQVAPQGPAEYEGVMTTPRLLTLVLLVAVGDCSTQPPAPAVRVARRTVRVPGSRWMNTALLDSNDIRATRSGS